MNLLLTCHNCAISTGFHSICLIQFVGWLSFKLNSHSCNTCGKSQKITSCRSLNTYLSRYLHSVNLGLMLSFCANSSSFVFNHISIFAFIGFHGLKIPFYSFILCVSLPWLLSPQYYEVIARNITICSFIIPILLLGMTQVRISKGFPKNPLKLSSLLVN